MSPGHSLSVWNIEKGGLVAKTDVRCSFVSPTQNRPHDLESSELSLKRETRGRGFTREPAKSSRPNTKPHTHTHAHTHTHTHTHTEIDRQTDRQTDRQKEKDRQTCTRTHTELTHTHRAHIHTHRAHTHTHTHTHTHRESSHTHTHTLTDGQTDREKEKERERQTDRHAHVRGLELSLPTCAIFSGSNHHKSIFSVPLESSYLPQHFCLGFHHRKSFPTSQEWFKVGPCVLWRRRSACVHMCLKHDAGQT